MVFVLSAAGALFLGIGWVVQQQVATKSRSGRLLGWTVLLSLISSWMWWLGIAALTVGQSLSAWALQFGPVSEVEPVLVASLLVAFVAYAVAQRQRPRWQELTGPLIVIVALTVFLTVGNPGVDRHSDPGWRGIAVASGAAAVAAAAMTVAAVVTRKRTPQLVESALLAAAAGVMYGLQDAATRGALVVANRDGYLQTLTTMWPWVVLAAATAGVLLSQAAFRAGRLDYALPPTVATQPIAGIIIGVTLLGDHLSASGVALAFEALCLVAMLAGVLLVGRSPAFGT